MINQEPLPWADWAAEFRNDMPDEIKTLIDDAAGNASWTDHSNAIKDRLKKIRDLFRFSRYRPVATGPFEIDEENVTRGGKPSVKVEPAQEVGTGGRGGRTAAGRAMCTPYPEAARCRR